MTAPERLVYWSRDARDDLAHIWRYCSQTAGQHVAVDIVQGIGKVCRLLLDHPLAGRERSEIRAGIRSVAASPHVIFYRINEASDVEIVRVLDGRQDIDEIFSS